jgi:ribosome maturation factor RimP
MSNVEMTLQDRLASLVTAMGYEFVGSEWRRQNQGSLLRIYIDKEDGIMMDDCSKVSRQISAMLDVEDPIQGRYTLEVSSPGLDRPLFEIAHYQKFVGNRVKLRLHTPLNSRRNFVGDLVRVEAMNIHLMVESVEIVVPFSSIEKANVIADIR